MTSYTIRGIEEEFWRAVKVLAATQGVSIKHLIIHLLTEAIKEGK